MASDPVAAWESVSLEEAGGAAGLQRGARIERFSLDADAAARIGALLKSIHCAHWARDPNRSRPTPGGRTLTLRLQSFHGEWQATFDASDLPAAVAELVGEFPPMRPLPLG